MRTTGRIAAIATFAVASAAALATARADDIVIFGTGVNGSGIVVAPGTADPHYTIIQAPAASGLALPRQATVARAHPAYVQNSPVGTAGTSWVAPLNNTDSFYALGTYVYRTTFDLTGLDPATAVLDGTVAVDDSVTDLRVNGVSLGAVGGQFIQFGTAFHVGSGFQQGVNTLDFVVVNLGGQANPSGLRVAVHGTAAPAIPVDATPPVIVGAFDRALSWQGSSITLVAATLGITAVDAVDGSVPVALSPNVVGLGTHVVTASATDAAGNAASTTFNVSVVDVTAPVISGPSSPAPTFGWHGSAIALTPALLGLSAADDVDGAVAVTLSPATAGLGTTSVTARATDAAGNAATRSFDVRVADVTAPVISGPSPAAPTFVWNGSPVALTPALLGLSATDDVDGAVGVTITPATAVVGSQLVTATSTDAAGNSATRSFTVTVTEPAANGCKSRRDSHDRDDDRDHSKDRSKGCDKDDDDRSPRGRSPIGAWADAISDLFDALRSGGRCDRDGRGDDRQRR